MAWKALKTFSAFWRAVEVTSTLVWAVPGAVLVAFGTWLFRTELNAFAVLALAVAGAFLALGLRALHRARSGRAASEARGPTPPIPPTKPPTDQPPKIDFFFEKRAPYEETEVTHGRVKSTVRIGLKNNGSTLSNCKVYIDKIVPEPPIPGGLPILLADANFTLRHDDPEKLVEIATHWGHLDKLRFSSPASHADALMFIQSQPARTIQIRITATDYQRSATFRISADETKALHMDNLGYVS